MRTVVLLSLMILGSGLWAVGCGGRSMGGDPVDEPDGGAGAFDAAVAPPGPCDPMDAWSAVISNGCNDEQPLGFAFDGAGCNGVWCVCVGSDCQRLYADEEACWSAVSPTCVPRPATGCEAQQVWGCPDGCVDPVGFYWDGGFCQPVICCCEGPDCAETYATFEACVDHRSQCFSDVCTDAGGYCTPDAPSAGVCGAGYRNNEAVIASTPGACGGGLCCTPCLDPDSSQVDYMGHSPEACAVMDWDCFSPGWASFQNDCGCGCYLVE